MGQESSFDPGSLATLPLRIQEAAAAEVADFAQRYRPRLRALLIAFSRRAVGRRGPGQVYRNKKKRKGRVWFRQARTVRKWYLPQEWRVPDEVWQDYLAHQAEDAGALRDFIGSWSVSNRHEGLRVLLIARNSSDNAAAFNRLHAISAKAFRLAQRDFAREAPVLGARISQRLALPA